MSPRSRASRRFAGLPTLAAAALLGGCATTSTARAAADFDRPVPPSEPRAALQLVVDLEPAQDCEERFDLALYRDRGVDLITWDDGVGSCVGRSVTIHYLSGKLDRQRLLDEVKELTRHMDQVKGGSDDDRS